MGTNDQLLLFGFLVVSTFVVYFRDKTIKERMECVKKTTPIKYRILLVGIVQIYLVPSAAFIEEYYRIFKIPKLWCSTVIFLSSLVFFIAYMRLFTGKEESEPTKT